MTRKLSDEERHLWRQITQHVTPLDPGVVKNEPIIILPPPSRPALRPPVFFPAISRHASTDAPLELGNYAGIDRRNAERVRKGLYPIDATLDLHGLSRDRACEALWEFIGHHYRLESRCLLVITGKGGKEPPGILKQALPQWLADSRVRPLILAFDKAKPHHGGGGAFYILLKRKRA